MAINHTFPRLRLKHLERVRIAIPIWGAFPHAMRPFWLAQAGRCPYCPVKIPLIAAWGTEPERPSFDHVFPRSRFSEHSSSYVICHQACNVEKADRSPTVCEVLFREFTNEIVQDILARKRA